MSCSSIVSYNGSVSDFLKEYDWKDLLEKSCKVLASCIHNRTVYFILEYEKRKILGFLTFSKMGGTVYYSESPGHHPTKHFLNAVLEHFPDMDKWTKEWFDICRKIKERKKLAEKVEDCNTIEFSSPLRLRRKDGSRYTETRFFVFNKKKGLFLDRNNEPCRIRCWSDFDFQIVR